MLESRLGTGEITGKIYPNFKRKFSIFQIASGVIEARFEDGLRPLRVEVSQMIASAVNAALAHALAEPVNLDCPRLASMASPSM